MSNLLRELIRPRAVTPWNPTVTHNGVTYTLPVGNEPSLNFHEEEILTQYTSVATLAYQYNPIVFACINKRRAIFSQARFGWQQVRGGTPGRMFGTAGLAPLEQPWEGATTNDLLGQVMLHADLAGNAFVVRRVGMLQVLRPDWVTIVAGSQAEPEQGSAAVDAEVVGYVYWPGGQYSGGEPVLLDPGDVAHFAPVPDPVAKWRGWSWVNTVRRDVMGDNAATTHKLKYFENGATPATVVSLDPALTLEKFNAWVEKFEQNHEGVANAYKTLFLGGGADAKVVGSSLEQASFKVVQGAGETRIAAAAQVPPALVGISEGLQGSALNASTYGASRREFAEGTIWPMWENLVGSLEHILDTPAGARLWVDTRDIPYFQEEKKDRADIQQMDASAINTLITSGFEPDAVIDAVTSNDLERLKDQHTGLYSVQLQPPGTEQSAEAQQVEEARDALIAEGIARPTEAQVAERLGVSDRTIRRWKAR